MDWRLIDGQPIVMYAANDRRGGRIYKFVSSVAYDAEIHTTKAAVRALLDAGRVYVSHFDGLDNLHGLNMLATGAAPTETAPGNGRWILMDLDNTTDIAPNAGAMATRLGDSALSSVTVGAALQDIYTGHDDAATDPYRKGWNGLCRFDNQNDLLKNLFTASMKIGVMELNRPEDVEWNPVRERLYIAFTYSGRTPGLTQGGLLDLDGTITTSRESHGGIFAIREEEDDPTTSTTFQFYEVWRGTNGTGVFDAGRPDNLMIDRRGGVWFGTDGNFGYNDRADALYYLDLDPNHMEVGPGGMATYGMAFRIAAGPSDAEATGPCLSSDMRTLFFNVQHPGETISDNVFSTWPHPQSR